MEDKLVTSGALSISCIWKLGASHLIPVRYDDTVNRSQARAVRRGEALGGLGGDWRLLSPMGGPNNANTNKAHLRRAGISLPEVGHEKCVIHPCMT